MTQLSTQSLDATLPNITELDVETKKTFYREVWSRTSRFEQLFGSDTKSFDIGEYGQLFADDVLRILKNKGVIDRDYPICELHNHIDPKFMDYNYDDGVNGITRQLYDTDEQYRSLYHRFIQECVAPHVDVPFYFQETTTIRLHCPGGEHANHYPRYHTDIGYGHPPEEINLWIPLTEPQGEQAHGFRLMSHADSCDTLDAFDYDFAPFIDKAINDKPYNATLNDKAPQVTTPLGSMLAFDSRCVHTGEPLEQHTRASIDIRIIPVDDFEAMPYLYQGSGRRKMKYVPGQGYHISPVGREASAQDLLKNTPL